jgi:hypothetical protein
MTRTPFTPLLGAVAAAAMALGFSLPAAAQSQSQPPAQQQAPAEVSEDDLRSFAIAAQKVKRINDEALPQIQSAETPEKAQTLRKKAETDMLAAVEGEGLTVDRYNQIYTMAQMDPDVRDRVMQHIQKNPQ